jgi:hypothetical protein
MLHLHRRVIFTKSFELGGDPTFKLVEILALGIVEPVEGLHL